MPTPTLHPWDIAEGETSLAYQAFAVYRDLGPERSLVKAGQKLGKNLTTLGQWSVKYRWPERAAAFDAEAARIASAKSLNEHAEVRARQAKAARIFQTRGSQRMAALDPKELAPSEAIRAFEVGAKVEREALGIPTSVAVTDPDGAPLAIAIIALPVDEL